MPSRESRRNGEQRVSSEELRARKALSGADRKPAMAERMAVNSRPTRSPALAAAENQDGGEPSANLERAS